MKRIILIITVLAMAGLQSIAQDIEYTYDAAGNRTARKVIPPPPLVTTEENNNGDAVNDPEPEVYKDVVAEKQLKIFPNPTRGQLAIEISNYDLNATGSIQVFDMSGRMVQNITQLSERMEIDITAEPAGSYIMIIMIGNEKSEWKVVKQ